MYTSGVTGRTIKQYDAISETCCAAGRGNSFSSNISDWFLHTTLLKYYYCCCFIKHVHPPLPLYYGILVTTYFGTRYIIYTYLSDPQSKDILYIYIQQKWSLNFGLEWYIIIIVAIRECVAWASALITPKHSERKQTQKRKILQRSMYEAYSLRNMLPAWASSTLLIFRGYSSRSQMHISHTLMIHWYWCRKRAWPGWEEGRIKFVRIFFIRSNMSYHVFVARGRFGAAGRRLRCLSAMHIMAEGVGKPRSWTGQHCQEEYSKNKTYLSEQE